MKFQLDLKLAGRKAHLEMGAQRLVAALVGLGLVGASVIRELRLPARQRTWHGLIFGRIPYDWRIPTIRRVKAAWWHPASRSVLRPRAFGVGWTVNLAALRPSPHRG